jgi:hypothetical protein
MATYLRTENKVIRAELCTNAFSAKVQRIKRMKNSKRKNERDVQLDLFILGETK